MKELFIKVCGMRDEDNIRSIVALRPHYLGFIFVPDSPRYVGDTLSTLTVHALEHKVKTVGVFKDAQLRDIVKTVTKYRLAAVQLHGNEDGAYIDTLRRELPETTLIKALSPSTGDTLTKVCQRYENVDIFLFDNTSGGSGECFDWSILNAYHGEKPFLLAGGIGLHNICDALQVAREHAQCIGIDVNSKVESSPGVKDEYQVATLLEKVRR